MFYMEPVVLFITGTLPRQLKRKGLLSCRGGGSHTGAGWVMQGWGGHTWVAVGCGNFH